MADPRQQQQELSVRVSVDITQSPYAGGGTLRMTEEFTIPAAGFIEMAKILGQFDDLAKKVKGING